MDAEEPTEAHYQAHERIDELWDEYDKATATAMRVAAETKGGDPKRTVAAIVREGARADVYLAIRDAVRGESQSRLEAYETGIEAIYAEITKECGYIDDCCGSDMDDTLCYVHEIQARLRELSGG